MKPTPDRLDADQETLVPRCAHKHVTVFPECEIAEEEHR